MQYLLLLQRLRELMPHFFNEGLLFLSEMMGGTIGLITMAIIYWGFSKKIGQVSLLSFGTSYMLNQTLKNIFCIPRPFLKNEALIPYKEASGYSFPSGHTMLGTSIYTSIGFWLKKHKCIVFICLILTLLTAFGRNWIGVHTLQDVSVGMLLGFIVVYINIKLLNVTQNNTKYRTYYFLFGLIWSIIIFFLFPKSEKVIGIYLGALCGYYLEMAWVQFEVLKEKRIMRILLGLALLLVLNKVLALLAINAFLTYFILFFYVSFVYPFFIKTLKI